MSKLYNERIEMELIRKCISANDTVFDVGANEGLWVDLALKQEPNQIHLFEPIQEIYSGLLDKYKSLLNRQIFVSNCALFDKIGQQNFYVYPDRSSLSTIYRRKKAERIHDIGVPNEPVSVKTTTIDNYCLKRKETHYYKVKIEHINYLKIDTEGAEFNVIMGAEKFLTEHKIDYVQFEYGGTYLDAGITLEAVYNYLRDKGYRIYKALRTGCQPIPKFLVRYEDYKYSIFVALAPDIKFKE